MSEKVRVLRVLEYVGDRKWVEETLSKGGVPANGQVVLRGKDTGRIIKSSLVGDFPEVLSKEEVKYHDLRVNNDRREFTIVVDKTRGEDDIYTLFDAENKVIIKPSFTSKKEIEGFYVALDLLGINAHTNYKTIE
ncbi:hypothetical protein [Bacillus infantis]|uniref:hypothetical protein n=1 Tax=Bacillus infantis TaxID=324767 RepID=UPI0020A204DF|nr:hypothetical protein [Bacillus infantis]MCP1159302.1 hypothetical protein [Bacillus infantis]